MSVSDRTGVEGAQQPPDYHRRGQFRTTETIRNKVKGRIPQSRGLRCVFTAAQAQALEEMTRGVEPTHHMVKAALRGAGDKLRKALSLWLDYRPGKGTALGVLRDERLRLLRMKMGIRYGKDIVARARELGHDLDEANVSDIETGRSRHPARNKLKAYCAATGIPFATAISLLPVNNMTQFETRPVSLPVATWAAIDAEEESLDEVLCRLYGEAD